MSQASPFSERLQDAVGPLVVKEVRQGLRGRVFGIFFGLLLLACLVMALLAAAEVADSAGSELGRDFLGAYLVAMGVVCYFVIPYTAFRSMVREREDETWVLLALTGLGARSIVRGKFASAMSQALLYASACGPFVVFSYYLNGVDLVQVGLALGLAAVWSAFLVAVAVALGTLAETRLGRAVAHFVVLGLLLLGTGLAFAMSVNLAQDGSSLLREDDFLAFCGALTLIAGGAVPALLEAGAANLALPSENAAKGPRLAVTAYLAAGWAAALLGSWAGKPSHDGAALGSVASSLVLVVVGLFAVSEEDGWPRATAKAGWLKPGALRSSVLALVLLVLSTGVWLFLHERAGGGSDQRLYGLLAAPLYPVCYLAAAAFLGRVTPLKRFGTGVGVRAAFAIVVALGMVLPPVLALLAGSRTDDEGANHLNPFFGLINFFERNDRSESRAGLVLLAAVTALFLVLGWVALASQDKERHA